MPAVSQSLLLLLISGGKLLQFIPEDETEHSVWPDTEEISFPTFVEANNSFLAEYLYEAVKKATVIESLPTGICALVVESCRDDIKWCHEHDSGHPTEHACNKCHHVAVWTEDLWQITIFV